MLHARVQQAGELPVQIGGSGSQRGNERQHQPDGRVQSAEFFIRGEGQIEMHGLQVGPAVGGTTENAVIFRVNIVIFMRPEDGVFGGVHPGVRGGRHEAGAPCGQQTVCLRQ